MRGSLPQRAPGCWAGGVQRLGWQPAGHSDPSGGFAAAQQPGAGTVPASGFSFCFGVFYFGGSFTVYCRRAHYGVWGSYWWAVSCPLAFLSSSCFSQGFWTKIQLAPSLGQRLFCVWVSQEVDAKDQGRPDPA